MNFKKVLHSIIYPHIVIVLILLPLSITFISCSLLYFSSSSIIAIISYILAFYTLFIICFRIPKIIDYFKNLKNKNKYLNKYYLDINFKIKVSLYLNLILNITYSIFQLCLGFYYQSIWFYTMAGYYLMLALIRFFLADYTKKYDIDNKEIIEAKRSLLCGYLLLFMNIILAVIISFIVLQNKTFNHSVIVTISLATYTFTAFIASIVGFIKYKKYNNLVYSCTKIISLITATISMLTLESTMLSTFSKESESKFNQIILIITGAIIITFTIVCSLIIIIKASKEYRKNKENSKI